MMQFNNLIEILTSKRECEDICIISNGVEFTYRELYKYAANYSINFAKNQVVGLICVNSIEFVVAYFAIIMAQGTVLLLNSELKGEEMITLCEQCSAKKLISPSSQFCYLDNRNIDFSVVDCTKFHVNGVCDVKTDCDCENIVTLIPTSGTTNTAKIVRYSHRTLINGIISTVEITKRSKHDVEIVLLSLSTRTALEGQLLTALAVGMKIVLFTGRLLPRNVYREIDKHKANFCSLSPSVFCLLFENTYDERFGNIFSTIVVVGEKLAAPIMENFFRKYAKVNLLYGYGMTETGPIAFKNEEDFRIKLNSVGKIVSGNEVLLEDVFVYENNKEAGEIIVQSKSMMNDYYKKAGKIFDGRTIRTGDIGYFDEDGYLYIIGRNKNIINSNGFKVFPEEIEGVLLAHEDIVDAMVRGEELDNGFERVVADVILRDGMQNQGNIIKYCREHLADYKVPKRLYICDKFETTGAMKKKKRT